MIFGERQINQLDLSTWSICDSLQIGLTVNTKDDGNYAAILSGENEQNTCRDAWRKALSDF